MNPPALKDFLHVMNTFCRTAEDEITFNIYLITNIPGVAVDYFFDGPPAEAKRNLLPFLQSLTERFGHPENPADYGSFHEETTSYLEYQQRFGKEPQKMRKMWKSAFLDDLTPEVRLKVVISCNSTFFTTESFASQGKTFDFPSFMITQHKAVAAHKGCFHGYFPSQAPFCSTMFHTASSFH